MLFWRRFLPVILIRIMISLTTCSCELVKNPDVEKYFLIELKTTNLEDAIELTRGSEYKLIKQINGFPNVFLFEKISTLTSNNEKRSNIGGSNYYRNIEEDERVRWMAQQRYLKRDKRDLIINSINDLYDYLNEIDEPSFTPFFNDELWSYQWYMQKNTVNRTGEKSLDLNVLPVYARGITGRGVRVAVLDDGIEYEHEDLSANFDPEISWDCNNDRPDPRPNYRDINNRHGTRCAGEIAMVANNRKCGVGVAFNSAIGGIKLLGGNVYDLIEGMALGFAYDKVDIYSSSWGPTDNGKSLEKPGIFAAKAIKRGIEHGRNGLGNVFVWASGNGGAQFDNCNCDGYAGSIYTITIGSVTQQGDIPWYSERCASILAVTHSSGERNDQMIATTDLGNTCTTQHTGTSASAPLAAGIIALGLEANPQLTWRDVQHIIVRTSEFTPLQFNKGWIKNGAARHYNTGLGFGLMNANSFVSLAVEWVTVPEQIVEKISGTVVKNNDLKDMKILFKNRNGKIKFLEHVELLVNIACKRRGDLKISLKSPSGTKVNILERRAHDDSVEGFNNWTFMSVATWSENPIGIWEVIVSKSASNGTVTIGDCTLILHGTSVIPDLR